jgi:hypothetical protein
MNRLRAWLSTPRMPRVAAAIVSVLLVPSLFIGLSADDYSHWLRARGEVPYGSRYDVFDFCDGSRSTVAFLKDAGIVSWWGLDRVLIHFFRPITSFTHFVDYTLWPGAPWLMHAENLVISAALAGFASLLYARLLGGKEKWIAGLASVLYAVDHGHGFVGWIAFRNGVLAAAFGVLALVLHDRWRKERKGSWVLGPLAFALGLASGEAASATLAYLLAYAVTVDRGSARSRAISLAPYAVVTIAWQLAYRGLGYGVVGSGIYLDPGREPLRFLREVPEHAMALVMGELGPAPADVVVALGPWGRMVFSAAALVTLLLFAWVVTPLLRESRTARFFAVGSLLSLGPICATLPSDRLLFFAFLGVAGLVAELAGKVTFDVPYVRRRAARAFLAVWMVPHAILAPPAFVTSSLAFLWLRGYFAKLAAGVPSQTELLGRTVVVVNAPDIVSVVYQFMVPTDGRMMHGIHGRILSLTYQPVSVTRRGPRTVELRADEDLASVPLASLFRSDSYPIQAGDVFHAGAMNVHVDEAAPNGHARTATFELEAPPEDPRFVWIAWDGERFVPFSPPEEGHAVRVGK